MMFTDEQLREIAWWAKVANYEGAADSTETMRQVLDYVEKLEESEWLNYQLKD